MLPQIEAGMSGAYQKAMFFMFKGYMIETQKTVQYRATWRPRSSRSIRWKGCSILYNLEASTMSGAFQEGMFFKFKGIMIKPQKTLQYQATGRLRS